MIKVKDLYFSYDGKKYVLKNINLMIRDKELVIIMGSNGAGKTTLIKHLNGLLKPSKGKILVNGNNTTERTVAELSRIVGLVFQNPDHQLFAETVEEEIRFGLKNLKLDEDEIEKRVESVLREFNLEEYRDRVPFSLSGGERKKVTIASVVAMDTPVIVLDEPTMGQDYRQKRKLVDMIEKLRGNGKTVIVVSHDVEFIMELKGRVVVMADGEVIAQGDKKEILKETDLLEKASLAPPQLLEILMGLSLKECREWVENEEELGEIVMREIKEKVSNG